MNFDKFQQIVERNDSLIRQCQKEIIALRDGTQLALNSDFKISELRQKIKSLTQEISDAKQLLH